MGEAGRIKRVTLFTCPQGHGCCVCHTCTNFLPLSPPVLPVLKGTDEKVYRGGVVALSQPTPERPRLLYY